MLLLQCDLSQQGLRNFCIWPPPFASNSSINLGSLVFQPIVCHLDSPSRFSPLGSTIQLDGLPGLTEAASGFLSSAPHPKRGQRTQSQVLRRAAWTQRSAPTCQVWETQNREGEGGRLGCYNLISSWQHLKNNSVIGIAAALLTSTTALLKGEKAIEGTEQQWGRSNKVWLEVFSSCMPVAFLM